MRKVLETCLAALEDGEHGITFSSGLGATTAITALLEAGDHLVAGDDLYGGTNRYIQRCLKKQGITYSFVDMTKVENVINAIQPNTKVRLKILFFLSLFQIYFVSEFHDILLKICIIIEFLIYDFVFCIL